jgi:3-hydroxyisobutyrate dehydrogenase-like beta-hydroxyacid dehydrogenase
MARVGFLGLGSMGQAMARRLLEAGHDVVVWNRSAEPRAELSDSGATAVETPAEALAVDLSVSMLANDDAADSVLSADNLPSDRIVHANMASVSPDLATSLSERFAKAGHGYVASPVLGRPHVAAEGGLNILAAGSTGDIERMKPLFDAMGQRTWPLGEHAPTANVVKIAVNYNIIHAIQALAESVAITTAAGVKPEDFVEVLTKTLFGGVVYSGYGALVAERSYTPTAFSLELGLKDLGLAESAAHSAGLTLPSSAVLRGLFESALADPEIADKDWSALAEVTLSQMKSEE